MNEESQEQSNSRPWLFKKGQSGNPGGRKKGYKSLKTRAKEYLEGLSDEEAVEYFEGLNKLDVWKMAEGSPETKSEVKVTEDVKVDDKQINAIRTALGLTNKATDSAGS